jgi:hypothetical protein
MGIDYGGLIDGILGLGSAAIKDNSRDDFSSLLQQQEQNNYDTSKQNYDAYNEYLTNVYGPAAAANHASSQAAARAAHAAAQANEAARAAAAQKASKVLTKRFKGSMKMLRPSINISNAVLPQMQQAYGKGLDGLNLLRAYMQSPQLMGRIGQAGQPVLSQDVGQLPEHMRGK